MRGKPFFLNVDAAKAAALASALNSVPVEFLAVESAAFPGVYLYMTGWGDYNDAGTGRVAGQYCPVSTAESSFPLFVRKQSGEVDQAG